MVNVLIVEDEAIARDRLSRAILTGFPELRIVGATGSIKETVAWLKGHPDTAEIIFMDVELSDGNCFEIFRQVEINASVIMTTAYDTYAVKAFEVNSIDYLLKPIEPESLKRAVERCLEKKRYPDTEKIRHFLQQEKQEYRQRYIVKMNDKIVPVKVSDIAYFYSEEKNTTMVTFEGSRYIIDFSLDILSEELDPKAFFRISRSCIINIQTIESIVKHFGSRLKIISTPEPDFEMTVSRSRVDDFLAWLEGDKD